MLYRTSNHRQANSFLDEFIHLKVKPDDRSKYFPALSQKQEGKRKNSKVAKGEPEVFKEEIGHGVPVESVKLPSTGVEPQEKNIVKKSTSKLEQALSKLHSADFDPKKEKLDTLKSYCKSLGLSDSGIWRDKYLKCRGL